VEVPGEKKVQTDMGERAGDEFLLRIYEYTSPPLISVRVNRQGAKSKSTAPRRYMYKRHESKATAVSLEEVLESHLFHDILERDSVS
jgi:hypothetical protein